MFYLFIVNLGDKKINNGQILFWCMQNTQLYVLGQGNEITFITAHARDFPSETTGYSFIHCHISGTGHGTFLGRAWRARPRVVFSYTDMSGEVNPLGWSDNNHPERDRLSHHFSICFRLVVFNRITIITHSLLHTHHTHIAGPGVYGMCTALIL